MSCMCGGCNSCLEDQGAPPEEIDGACRGCKAWKYDYDPCADCKEEEKEEEGHD